MKSLGPNRDHPTGLNYTEQDQEAANFQLGGRSEFSQFYNESDLLEDASVPLSSSDDSTPPEENVISNASPQPATTPSLKDLKKKSFLRRSKTWGVVFFLFALLVIAMVVYFMTTWKSHINKKMGPMPQTLQVAGDNNSVGNATGQKDSIRAIGVDSEKTAQSSPSGSSPSSPSGMPAPLATKPLSGPASIGTQPGPGQPITFPAPAVDQYGRPIAPEVPMSRFDAPMGVQSGRVNTNQGGIGGSTSANNSSIVNPAALMAPFNGAAAQGSSTPSSGGSFGGNLTPAKTPKATASMIGNRSLILAQGADIPCVLDTAIASDLPSMPRCHTPKDIYSDDGKVVLAEAGTTFTGESGAVAMKNGQSRLYVLWSRLKTPTGVIAQIDSPGADALGRGGLSGDVDKRWGERIGSAFLLSLVQDSIAYAATRGGNSNSPTVFQNTTNAGNQMATEVLKDSLSIPPRLTINQGEVISIHVARDIDFSSVYQLRAK